MTAQLNPQRLHLASSLRAKCMTWKDTAEVVGCSLQMLKSALIPGYRERRSQRSKENRERPRKQRSFAGLHKAPGFSAGHLTRTEPPDEVLLERERALASPRSLTARALGDPLPGRSELDRKLRKIGS